MASAKDDRGRAAKRRRTPGMAWPSWLLVAVACSSGEGAPPVEMTAMGAAGANGEAGAQAAGSSGGAAETAEGASSAAGQNAAPGNEQADATAPEQADAGAVTPEGDAAAGGQPVPARATGPGDWSAGDYPPGLMSPNFLEIADVPGQKGNVRQYKVHVPPSYDPERPTPLVFCVHGLGQDALLFCITGAEMHTKSDEAGFILVMPNGYQNSWNGGTCCGAASTEQLDDVALFRAILQEVGTHVNIDLGRVYATGLSNGGYMSLRLSCDAADLFTAVAAGAGAVGMNDIGGGTNPASDFTRCEPSQAVSVLAIHGTADPLIPYALVEPSLAHMAEQNGCAATTGAAELPASAGDTTCISHTGCPAGIELTGCTIEAGGHCWFGSPDCGTGGGVIGLAIVGQNSDTMNNTDAVWEFFSRLSR